MESLSFEKTKLLLAKYKIPLCPTRLVLSFKEADDFADRVGYPLVLKISSKDVLHKSDFGFVKTNIKDKNDLKKAWDELEKQAEKKRIKMEGILVQKQLSGIEIVIGMKKNNQFGPVLMFGLGGILVEILKDVSFRIAPVTKTDAVAMIKEVKGYKLLEGYRSIKSVDIGKIAEIIISLSKLSLENENITEIDLNHIMVNEKGAFVADPRFLIYS